MIGPVPQEVHSHEPSTLFQRGQVFFQYLLEKKSLAMSAIISVLSNLLVKVEEQVRCDIRKIFWDVGEDFITTYFARLLTFTIDDQKALVQEAICAEIKSELYETSEYSDSVGMSVNEVVENVAKQVRFTIETHNKSRESHSTGDFGLVVGIPKLDLVSRQIVHQQSGLLCQAKVTQRGSKTFGKFTNNQKEYYPQRHEFLAIILYEYADDARKDLRQFAWINCKSLKQIMQVTQAFSKRDEPHAQTSNLLPQLIDGRFGTTNPETIQKYILSSETTFEFRIEYPPDVIESLCILLESTEKPMLKVRNPLS